MEDIAVDVVHCFHAYTVPLSLLITIWLFCTLTSLAASATGSTVSGSQYSGSVNGVVLHRHFCTSIVLVLLYTVKHFSPFTHLAISCFSRLFLLQKIPLLNCSSLTFFC